MSELEYSSELPSSRFDHLDKFDDELEWAGDGGLSEVLEANIDFFKKENPIMFSTLRRVSSYFDHMYPLGHNDPSHIMANFAFVGMMTGLIVTDYKLEHTEVTELVKNKLKSLENWAFMRRDWFADGLIDEDFDDFDKDEIMQAKERIESRQRALDRLEGVIIEDGSRYVDINDDAHLSRQLLRDILVDYSLHRYDQLPEEERSFINEIATHFGDRLEQRGMIYCGFSLIMGISSDFEDSETASGEYFMNQAEAEYFNRQAQRVLGEELLVELDAYEASTEHEPRQE